MVTLMNQPTPTPKKGEAGFTLAEALIATLILMFGLASIFNLMIVGVSSNSLANRASGSTAIAVKQLEVLRATPFFTRSTQTFTGAAQT